MNESVLRFIMPQLFRDGAVPYLSFLTDKAGFFG
jgi:hypothetical protein